MNNTTKNMKFKALLFSAIAMALLSMNTNGQMARVEGEILIQLEKGVTPEQLAAEHGNLQSGKLLSAPMNIYKFQFAENSGADALLEAIRSNPKVSLAQFNHIVTKRCDEINDPSYGSQWHLENTGQNGGTADADIDIDLAWGITTGGTTANGDEIVVCVIEGGNLNHTDLQANAWKNLQEIPNNGIDDDNNGYVDDYLGWDVNSNSDGGSVLQGPHGTNVMGMIGATGGNNIGVIGANWDVKIMSVSGENIFVESSVIEAYTYPLSMRRLYNETNGESGAFVVATNASWGIDQGDPNEVPLWNATYDSLGVHGVLNCGATANAAFNIDAVGDIPTALPSDYMVSVTATNSNDVRTFSGFGATTIDVGAPGENVVTTAGTNQITTTSGTSFASPLTAGVIALLYSAPCESFAEFVRNDPQGGADLVREALFNGVDVVSNLVGETVTGGRINSFNSLMEIMDGCLDENICIPPLAFESELANNDTVYTISWTNVTGNPASVRFKPQDSEDWFVFENLDETSLVFDTLSICTTYDFEIGSTCEENGEVLYTSCLTISTLGCCVAPETLELETSEETEADVSWSTDFGIDSYNVYYRLMGDDEWILFGNYEETDEAVVDGLEPCTDYEFLVSPACAEDQDAGVMSDIRTKGCGACLDNTYCENLGEDSSEEYIDVVTIGDYTFETGNNGGYALFEDFDIVLVRGETYDALLTPGFPEDTFEEFFRVWIDFNQNGFFASTEEVLVSTAGSSDPLAGQITIPEDAPLGNSRMRIAMKYVGFGIPDNVNACEQFTWGETEDYCITISEVTSVNENNGVVAFNVYPNPSGNEFNLDFNLTQAVSAENVVFRMFDVSGKEVKSLRVNQGLQQINVSELENGMYIYRLQTIDGKNLRSGKWVKTL